MTEAFSKAETRAHPRARLITAWSRGKKELSRGNSGPDGGRRLTNTLKRIVYPEIREVNNERDEGQKRRDAKRRENEIAKTTLAWHHLAEWIVEKPKKGGNEGLSRIAVTLHVGSAK
ncbi:hypothetical protein KM043_009632 [Ampulex compressa]|nr:hypothetical protein KM043_009632 [Ampulex compressa]